MVLIISGRTTDFLVEVMSQPKYGRQANVFGAFIGVHKAEVGLRPEAIEICRKLIYIL